MYYTWGVFKMKFYNREKELDILKSFIKARNTRFLVVKGLRRIGKTRLILEALKNKNFVYIFVPKDETVSGFLEFLSKDLNIPRFTSLYDLFRYVFERYRYVFIDEFQNFYYMDKSIYSYLQKMIDEYKRENRNICIFVSGSSYSLMEKIFSDYAKALYGRKDIEISLEELPITTICEILDDFGIKNLEDKFKFWAIFGGIPKFYELIGIIKPKTFAEFVQKTFLTNYKTLLDEGKSILISEFGGEHKIYYSVLEAISEGKTKISEIASKFNNDINATNRYTGMVRNEYKLIERIYSLTGKKGIYRLKNNFIRFWFEFIKRYENYYERGNLKGILEFFKENFNSYLGHVFEEFVLDLTKQKLITFGFKIDRIGKQWGKFNGEIGKNTYEIDIVALSKKTKEILFAECKWKDRVNALKVVKGLAEKSKYVDWHNEKRKESFAVFAKSFSKRIKEFNGRKVYCFDLKDLEKVFKRNSKIKKRKI